jgi:hypothetical protein
MLETIQKLESMITQEQRQKLEGILKDTYPIFSEVLRSENEAEAKERVEKFTQALKRAPLKALKLNRLLTKEQRSIVFDLMPDDEGDDD